MACLGPTEWSDIVGYVRVNYPDLARGWFAHLRPSRLENGVLTVEAGNSSQLQYLANNCHRPFCEGAQAATGRLVSVQFISNNAQSEASGGFSFEREATGLKLVDEHRFATFVTGPCNRLAHAAAVAVSESPGEAYNPLFLYGAVGLGKTHLLQAICHAIVERQADRRVLYISCETFINHFLEAVEHGVLHQFRHRYRHVDMLAIDDIQFLAERERSQEEFFHTFNTLHQSQKQIIVCADCCPAELPGLQERLISRFNSGLVALMDRPCLETRMAIVRSKAKLRCIEVPEEVIKLIASTVETNIRELEGALIKIDALSQTRGGEIDMELALEAMEGIRVRRNVNIPEIIDLVTSRYNVRLSDLQGRKRTKSVSLPRQICMYLARHLTQHSLDEIGGFFGGRDHSTVLHGTRLIEERGQQDPNLQRELEDMTNLLVQGKKVH